MRNSFLMISCVLLAAACSEQPGPQALGTLERDRVILKATANEIIVDLPVTEGSSVAKGDLLVALDNTRQLAKVAHAQADVMGARAALDQLRNGARKEDVDAARAKVHGAQANLLVAGKNYLRAQKLEQQQLTSQAALDAALGERDSAEAAFESATKSLLALTNGTRQEELDKGEALLNAAQAQLDLENYILSELNIRATRDGYLDSLPWNVGERVQEGSSVAVLLADKGPFARVYVPEPWRAKIQIGDEFSVFIDGREDVFKGRLRWIATEPAFTPYYALNKHDRSRLVYVAEVDIQNGHDLPTGVPVQVGLE